LDLDVRLDLDLDFDERLDLDLDFDERLDLDLDFDVRLDLDLRLDFDLFLGPVPNNLSISLSNSAEVLSEFKGSVFNKRSCKDVIINFWKKFFGFFYFIKNIFFL
jgi:hypothetical protein